MKTLVTGGAGFIGSHLCEALLNAGHSVRCIDNLLSGKLENIAHLQSNPAFEFAKADIRFKHVIEYLEDIDVIFNLAASKKNVCLSDPHKDLYINADGTLNLLQAAARCNIKKFIHASTGSVYGNTTPQSETAPTVPVSYYGISKLAGENYVRLFSDKLPTAVLRYFHVFGSRQADADNLGGVIAIFLRHIYQGLPISVYGDGSQTRCFTYVKDVVKANLALLNKEDNSDYYLANCVSDTHITLNELIIYLFVVTGKSVPVVYKDWQVGDIKEFAPDNNRIKQLINFTPFEIGLQETIDAYRCLYS